MSQWGQTRTFTGPSVNGDAGFVIDVVPLVIGPTWSSNEPMRSAKIDGLMLTHIAGSNERADAAFKLLSKHYGNSKATYGEWLDGGTDLLNLRDGAYSDMPPLGDSRPPQPKGLGSPHETDAEHVRDYLSLLSEAGITVPPAVLRAAERLAGEPK